MTALGIIAVLVQLALAFVNYLTNKGQLEADTAKQLVTQLQGTIDIVQKAQAARQSIRDHAAADPNVVRDVPDPDTRQYRDGDVG